MKSISRWCFDSILVSNFGDSVSVLDKSPEEKAKAFLHTTNWLTHWQTRWGREGGGIELERAGSPAGRGSNPEVASERPPTEERDSVAVTQAILVFYCPM